MFRRDESLFMGFLVRKSGELFGYIDRCPHAGLPLSMLPDRFLTREGDLILCSSHGALFRIGDGLCVGGPCAGQRLWPWAVSVADGVVMAA